MTNSKQPTAKTTKPSMAKSQAKTTTKATSKSVAGSPDGVEGQLVRLHELKGFAAFFLPAELEQILGESDYQALREELRRFAITVMVRDVDRLIHVHLPVMLTQREPLLPSKAATTKNRRTARKGGAHG